MKNNITNSQKLSNIYYVYRITNTKLNKHYYGSRTSKNKKGNTLLEDLKIYQSSSSDKVFKQDMKENFGDYKFKIIKTFKDVKLCYEYEIRLHKKFNVGVNKNFYNKSKQTNVGFSTTGVKNPQSKDGRTQISKSRKGKMTVKDIVTNIITGTVDVNHEKVLSGEWVHHSKGTILSQEERNKRASPGEKNGRYSGQKDENLIEYAKEYYSLFKIIPTWNKLIDYVKLEYNIQLIKSLSKFRFNYNNLNGNKGFIAIMENITGDTHDSRCSFNCFNITKELIEKYKKGNN